MGTRSLCTFIETYEDSETKKKHSDKLVTIYQQYDGYLEGVGASIAEFLNSGEMVNGFGRETSERQFNGISCLAGQFIAEFKQGVGGMYIYRGGSKGMGEEYHYEIEFILGTGLRVRAYKTNWDTGNKGKKLFDGTPKEFLEHLKSVDA